MEFTTHLVRGGCPYCGERIELVVDASVPEQQYIEDCQVCCRPMVVTAQVSGDDIPASAAVIGEAAAPNTWALTARVTSASARVV